MSDSKMDISFGQTKTPVMFAVFPPSTVSQLYTLIQHLQTITASQLHSRALPSPYAGRTGTVTLRTPFNVIFSDGHFILTDENTIWVRCPSSINFIAALYTDSRDQFSPPILCHRSFPLGPLPLRSFPYKVFFTSVFSTPVLFPRGIFPTRSFPSRSIYPGLL